MDKIDKLLECQRTAFNNGEFSEIKGREQQLWRLFDVIKDNEAKIAAALHTDLGKSEFEARATEISIVLDEISAMAKNLKHYARPEFVPTAIFNWPSSGQILREPYGQVLIFSAWNYPFQLLMLPLLGAVAAGNCVVAKPAEQAPATAKVIEALLGQVFESKQVLTVQGGRETAEELLKRRFDYIFYTGGENGGKAMLRAAAEFLTPVTLELGGKSPCIVDADAKLDLSAKRIIWGKFLNAGQTCVAPDYLLVHKSLKPKLIERMNYWIKCFYGDNPLKSADYPRIVNDHHVERLLKLYPNAVCDREKRYIAPTLIPEASADDLVMKEEVFGPLLPILEFEQLTEAIKFINERPKPLALYYFGKSGLDQVLRTTSSGGVCVNDTVTHLVNPAMPFGGVGNSGIGAYHGKWSFELFSHLKPVMRKSTLVDLPMRYPPYSSGKLKMLKALTK